MAAERAETRGAGALIAFAALAVGLYAFVIRAVTATYHPEEADTMAQMHVAIALALAIAVLGSWFEIKSQHSPRPVMALVMLGGALGTTAVSLLPQPFPYAATLVALLLAGAAWVVDHRAVTA